MKQKILAAATLLMALLIVRQQDYNLRWEIQQVNEAYAEAAAAYSTMVEELTAQPKAARTVLTEEQRKELDEMIEAQEGCWSVYLLDLTSGEQYLYNQEAAYYPASLLKAPFAYWLAQKADAGELNFAQKIPNCKAGTLAGSDLEKYNKAKTVPVMAALHSMIANSNNDAVTLLANRWAGTAENGFNDFLTQLGFTYVDTVRIDGFEGIQGMATVEDIGATMKALYDYFEAGSPNAYDLKRCFIDAHHQMLYVPHGVLTAKKYGSWQYAYHDAAIVYGEYPYILCMMSDRGQEEVDFPEEPTETMRKFGKLVWEMLEK